MISRNSKNTLAALAVGTLATLAFAPVSEAASSCRQRTDGFATGQGLFGMGTAYARSRAVEQWAEKVQARWGINYANFNNAVGVQWNCKPNAILQARCSVSARPCLP